MSQSDIQSLKAENLSVEELRLHKAQQVIDELHMAAKQNERLKRQLEAVASPEGLVDIAARQGYKLTVADLEVLRRRAQEQAQLNSEEFDSDELNEQELDLVAGGGSVFNDLLNIKNIKKCGFNGFNGIKWPPFGA